MVHQAIVGYENYVYCHDCGIVKSQLSGKIIKPKNGIYHFYNDGKITGVPEDNLYVYDTRSSYNVKEILIKIVKALAIAAICLGGWTVLIITFCPNSRSG